MEPILNQPSLGIKKENNFSCESCELNLITCFQILPLINIEALTWVIGIPVRSLLALLNICLVAMGGKLFFLYNLNAKVESSDKVLHL